MWYVALKHLHVTFAVLSGLGFLLRGIWMWRESPLLKARLTRILPQMVDTLLLASALSMVWYSAQYPFVLGWLTAKVFGLMLYIVLGVLALRSGRTKRVRILCFFLALLTFSYIVMVALTHQPFWFLP